MKRTTAVICLSSIVFLASVLAVGNSIAFANGGVIDKYFSKSQSFDGEQVEEALTLGKELAMEICENGDVLLKNENNTLPLEVGNTSINIFGWGGCENGFMYQGGGSSEGGYSADKISLYDAFRDSGFSVNESLCDAYNSLSYRREGSPDRNQHSVYYRTYEPGADFYTTELMEEAVSFSDTAVIVLSRRATEGDDLPKVSYDENGNADDSRNYLALTDKEQLMIDKVTENFDKVICLINTSAPMEMGFLDNDKIDAALWVGYPGYYGAMAIPNILSGVVTPSGHMSDTCAYELSSAPSYVNSGPDATHTYSGKGGNYKDYAENIYVGYKWYETADEEGYFDNETRVTENGETKKGYQAVVQYPFGHGLSYTDFDWDLESITNQEGKTITENSELDINDTLTFKVWVENVGNTYFGKDAVQLYFSPEYTEGGIEKASQNLVGFEKTTELKPRFGDELGDSQALEISVKVSDLASYDTYDSNNNGFMGYELEGGKVTFSLRVNSHDVKIDKNGKPMSYSFRVKDGGYQIRNDSTTGNEVKNRFTTYTNENSGASSVCDEPQTIYPLSIDGNDKSADYNQNVTYLTRADFAGTFPKATAQRSMSDAMFNNVFVVHSPFNNEDDERPLTDSTKTSWTLDDVKGLPYEDPKWDELISQLSVNELQTLSAKAGFGTIAIPDINKGACVDSDGGTGFTSGIVSGDGGHAIKYPAANVLASTFDIDLAYKWGHSIGEEGKALKINGWYAPGCNVHRSPLGGRNFEYFSEDGFMCGKFVAQTVKACTENGVYAYMKHFAANDTDEGRNGQFIWMTEQSLREIWAKPGELATKEGKANAMMASVDRIGATRATGSYALLTSLLRDEWGFRGSVITDYYQAGNVNDIDEGIRAGNDMVLQPSGGPSYFEDYANPSNTTLIALQNAAHNILYTYIDTIDRTEKFTGVDMSEEIGQRREDTSGRWWRYVLYSVDGVVGVGFLTWGALCIYLTWLKPRKEREIEDHENA